MSVYHYKGVSMELWKPKARYCGRCGHKVKREFRIREYPFYCPHCDENMYGIETLRYKELKELKERGYYHDI